MISASDIGELIRKPDSAGTYPPSALAEIRDKFPYCGTLHLLYLKALSLGNDLQFEEHLRYAAIHVADRERMYYLIHSGKNEPVTESETTEIPAEITPVFEPADLTKPVPETETVISEPDITPKEELTTTDQETTAEEALADNRPNLLDAAPDLIEIAYTQDLAAEEKAHASQSLTTVSEAVKPETTAADEAKLPPEKQPETAPDLSKLSFIEWLHYKQTKVLPTKAESETNTEKPAELSNDLKDQAAEKPEKTKKTGLSRLDVDALLNKFITEEPSISRPTANFFSPTKTAKQSLEEAPDLVTETLAKIYVLQKNYAKAIQAYEQLSLVYPEKKTFFATRIQKIKEDQQKQ
ncbi:MAG: hypothetical protein HYZ14_14755 [Bacteroidetes bacterium]|nr:hypothetical protein [Bacteroidota bacterium]